MFEIIFLIADSFYFIQTVFFTMGAKKTYTNQNDDERPTVSVIVAARDEEENIQNCLTSLNNLNYPEGKIQIIIVDDKSTDSTGEIVNEFIKDKTKFLLA